MRFVVKKNQTLRLEFGVSEPHTHTSSRNPRKRRRSPGRRGKNPRRARGVHPSAARSVKTIFDRRDRCCAVPVAAHSRDRCQFSFYFFAFFQIHKIHERTYGGEYGNSCTPVSRRDDSRIAWLSRAAFRLKSHHTHCRASINCKKNFKFQIFFFFFRTYTNTLLAYRTKI